MPAPTPAEIFQSTLPARGATAQTARLRALSSLISIHAPRTGSDRYGAEHPAHRAISIHAPRTGSDHQRRTSRRRKQRFQSTLPARGATYYMRAPKGTKKFQSTLPARGATTDGDAQAPPRKISIHAPRTGSDAAASNDCHADKEFQSTLPARGATPRAGDERGGGMAFQSTLPARGATGRRERPKTATKRFQSTLPARGATGFAIITVVG